jgi:hypothetical protein
MGGDSIKKKKNTHTHTLTYHDIYILGNLFRFAHDIMLFIAPSFVVFVVVVVVGNRRPVV